MDWNALKLKEDYCCTKSLLQINHEMRKDAAFQAEAKPRGRKMLTFSLLRILAPT